MFEPSKRQHLQLMARISAGSEEFQLCKGSFRTDLADNCLSELMKELGLLQFI